MVPAVRGSVPVRRVPRAAGDVSSAVQVQRDSDDVNLTHNFSVGLLVDLFYESIHGCSNRRKVLAQIISVALSWHGLVVLGRNVDDPQDMGNACILGDAVDCRNELV